MVAAAASPARRRPYNVDSYLFLSPPGGTLFPYRLIASMPISEGEDKPPAHLGESSGCGGFRTTVQKRSKGVQKSSKMLARLQGRRCSADAVSAEYGACAPPGIRCLDSRYDGGIGQARVVDRVGRLQGEPCAAERAYTERRRRSCEQRLGREGEHLSAPYR